MILSIGIFISILGLIFILIDKFPNIYNNPLDFTYKKGDFSFYFPLGTSILLSVIISFLFYLFKK